MIISILSACLSMLSPVNIIKSNDDPTGTTTNLTQNWSGQYAYYTGNTYETFYHFASGFRDNTYGYTYNENIYITIDDYKYLLYQIEFRNDNSTGNTNKYWIDVTMTHSARDALLSGNFTCSMLFSFFQGGTIRYQLASRIYDQSDKEYDYNDRYFVGLYPNTDYGFSGAWQNSRYYGSWYDMGFAYDDIYLTLIWQYNNRVIDNTDIAYDNGYKEGYTAGYNDDKQNVYDEGYSDGSYSGYQQGYTEGYQEAENQDATTLTIFNGILSVGILPVQVFMAMLNWEVFGINIGSFVSATISVLMLIILFRFIFKSKVSD